VAIAEVSMSKSKGLRGRRVGVYRAKRAGDGLLRILTGESANLTQGTRITSTLRERKTRQVDNLVLTCSDWEGESEGTGRGAGEGGI